MRCIARDAETIAGRDLQLLLLCIRRGCGAKRLAWEGEPVFGVCELLEHESRGSCWTFRLCSVWKTYVGFSVTLYICFCFRLLLVGLFNTYFPDVQSILFGESTFHGFAGKSVDNFKNNLFGLESSSFSFFSSCSFGLTNCSCTGGDSWTTPHTPSTPSMVPTAIWLAPAATAFRRIPFIQPFNF